jgi:cytochrome c peroxidase
VFLDHGGKINDPNAGDSVVDAVETVGAPIVNEAPFKGMSINCRSCHFVDDLLTAPGGGMRTYADFARRSPIPARADGKTHTPRNSPALVNSTMARPGGVLFHLDAEFNSMEDLVAATLTGRNFGWLPGEKAQAIAHIARVVKGDDGSFDLTDQFAGLSYRIIFTGTNNAIPDELRLPPEFRAFIGSGTEQEVFNAVVKVIAAYVNGLLFSQTEDSGAPIRSPFDVFLEINGLPQQPDQNETPLDYSRRLLQLVTARELAGTLQFVTTNPNRRDGKFQFHPSQDFTFRADELAGLKIFLAEPPALPPIPPSGVGNCIACHAAPNFTDFKLHNTGVAQREYDDPALGHAAGSFAALVIPRLVPDPIRPTRTADDLPATEQHPGASERFRSIPTAGKTLTDLGVWNIFANPDMSNPLVSNPQAKIRAILCDDQDPCPLSDAELLDLAIARFKTPGLRDLGHSNPYMHNGQFDTLENAVGFYLGSSSAMRGGTLRNGASALRGIALIPADIAPLAAFLKSLNEDYQ